MVKAFIVGKFMPFHKGHEAMIHFALTKCDLLTVLVCCSDKEPISSETRVKWIDKTFESTQNIEVKIFNYSEKDLPNTSVSCPEVSKKWAEIFKSIFPDYQVIISSEKYGYYVASYLGIKHIEFDIPRQLNPISATAVRHDLLANWNFLPDSVKPDYAIKIVILGTESTGKTTLCNRLVRYYQGSAVREVGRDLIPDSKSFDYNDLQVVASEHAKCIDQAVCRESPIIIIDTDIHTTKSYAKFIFNRDLDVAPWIYKSNKADLYLYLRNDVSHIQDGTRLKEAERNLLDLSHKNILIEKKIEFFDISGDWDQRFEKAVEQINRTIALKVNNL